MDLLDFALGWCLGMAYMNLVCGHLVAAALCVMFGVVAYAAAFLLD